jgi:hypothetical protein
MLQTLGEVIRRDALEVEPRDELLEVLRAPQVRRQDLARELETGAVAVDTAIVDARLLDFERADAGVDRAAATAAVSHNESVASFVELELVLVDVARDLGLDGLRQHLLSAGAENFGQGVLG